MADHLCARRAPVTGCVLPCLVLCVVLSISACSSHKVRTIEATGYCGCGDCAGWVRGRWKYLKLNFWNRYVDRGPRKGSRYSGRTASGTRPREPHPGFLSVDTFVHPWMVPIRLVFPWLWLAHNGTVAADTRYYPFGTRLYVPGYGHGVVEDRGGAIKGPRRIDLYFNDHDDALKWGRRTVEVRIEN